MKSHWSPLVAVGRSVTQRPPHRSVLEILPHTAPASRTNVEARRFAQSTRESAVTGAGHEVCVPLTSEKGRRLRSSAKPIASFAHFRGRGIGKKSRMLRVATTLCVASA
jgi:hypothetical protein